MNSEERRWLKEIFQKRGLNILDEEMDKLFATAVTKNFPAFTKIVMRGEKSDFVFMIRRGNASVCLERNGKNIPVAKLKEGDIFGEIGVLQRELRSATVIADTPMETLMMFREDFRKFLVAKPDVESYLKDLIQKRIEEIKQIAGSSILGKFKGFFSK